MLFNMHFFAIISAAIASQVPLEHAPTCMTTVVNSGYSGPGFYNILSLVSPSNVAASLSDPVINSSVVAQ